ncbi:MAG TPA: LamG domain-containing protein [Candidatus Udaeobacter sp.]|nr:LamG domain-containing protein [Candidatus Udaeobacter sp.]
MTIITSQPTASAKPATRATTADSLFGTGSLAANTWTHLAGTYDGTTLRFYVNGVQVSSRAQTGAISISTNALQIGGDSIYGQYFSGIIDDVRVYSRALSATEIQHDMNTGITP